MAKYQVTGPDGANYEVGAPDDASEADVMAYVQQNAGQSKAAPTQTEAAPNTVADEMSGTERFNAGMGRGLANTVRGVRQIGAFIGDVATSSGLTVGPQGQRPGTPMPRSTAIQHETDLANERDAPLLDTASGQAGNVTGLALPYLATAGVSSFPGAAVVGALGGFAGTPGNLKERAKAGAWGAGGGVTGLAAGRGLTMGGRALFNRSAAAGQQKAATNVVRDATMKEGIDAGYSVSPMHANPNAWNWLLESAAGKLSTAQGAAVKNQGVTNDLARQAIGISGRGGISKAELEAAKAPHFAVYKEVENLSPDAAQAVALWRQANFDANAYGKFFARTADPAAQKSAAAARSEANQWHQFIEQEAAKTGRPELSQALSASRVMLAKIGTVDNALEESTGNVIAKDIARAFSNGKPLSNELETIGRFSEAFPKQTQNVTSSMPGASPLDWTVAVGSSAATGNPAFMALAAARPIARKVLLSQPYQNALAVPKYGPGRFSNAAVNALESRLTPNAFSRVGAADAQQE